MNKFCMTLLIILIAGFASIVFARDAVKPVIIDVRTTQEWNNGHLEGAVLIPYDQIGEKIGSIVKSKSGKIYVYCRSGRRSKIAKETLEKMGYRDIVDLGPMENAARILNRKVVNN